MLRQWTGEIQFERLCSQVAVNEDMSRESAEKCVV